MFEIGKVYRYSNQKSDCIEPIVDGLPNFFYETRNDRGDSNIVFQKGIHQIKSVKLEDGTTRVPAIIISSSPHKARTDITPWEDVFDPDYGHIKYYGDAKNKEKKASEWPGNELLLEMFTIYSSPEEAERMLRAVPLVFFKRVEVDGRKKGNLEFEGFGIIESVELITQFDPKLSNPYFSNYVFNMCVFSIRDENEFFSWEWIEARRNKNLSTKETLKYAPKAWRKWIKEGTTGLYKVRRNISVPKIIKKSEQIPERGSKEEDTLKRIYDFYSGKKHIFELLAMRVTQEIFEDSGAKFYPGWITSKSGDRGIDFVARMDVSSQLSALKIIILGQAKCEKLDNPTNGVHIARTVARLKRGWFGVYVTTSYFSDNVQLEVMDDQYPIMLICGKKIAETVGKIIYKKGMTVEDFLCELEYEYHTDNKRIEEILSC
ncbi:restriction endonuclease [Butyrivibrio sp. NC2002]|uniref:restriction endonuclease n=1 Tax=Butyrivibrio sp. NC2002 TaxID=1410610 RepID=UPI000560CEE5|nr:restriction endonuclease [Butyrivibrio sp. NC2002]